MDEDRAPAPPPSTIVPAKAGTCVCGADRVNRGSCFRRNDPVGGQLSPEALILRLPSDPQGPGAPVERPERRKAMSAMREWLGAGASRIARAACTVLPTPMVRDAAEAAPHHEVLFTEVLILRSPAGASRRTRAVCSVPPPPWFETRLKPLSTMRSYSQRSSS